MIRKKLISVLSIANYHAQIIGSIGIIAGFLYAFGGVLVDISVTADFIETTETPGLSFGTVLAFGALIGMPLIFSLFGYGIGLIDGLAFNLLKKKA